MDRRNSVRAEQSGPGLLVFRAWTSNGSQNHLGSYFGPYSTSTLLKVRCLRARMKMTSMMRTRMAQTLARMGRKRTGPCRMVGLRGSG